MEEAESEYSSPIKMNTSYIDQSYLSASPELFKRRSRLSNRRASVDTDKSIPFAAKSHTVTFGDRKFSDTINYNSQQSTFKNTKIHPGGQINNDSEEETKSRCQQFKEFFLANEPEKNNDQNE